MADLRQCSKGEPHEYHGWEEDAPKARFGKHFHVCRGVTGPHMAFPKPAIIHMYPTTGGWRASCTCGWMESKVHRSEAESHKAARAHLRHQPSPVSEPRG